MTLAEAGDTRARLSAEANEQRAQGNTGPITTSDGRVLSKGWMTLGEAGTASIQNTAAFWLGMLIRDTDHTEEQLSDLLTTGNLLGEEGTDRVLDNPRVSIFVEELTKRRSAGGAVYKTDGHLAMVPSERGKLFELDNTRLKNDADKCRHAEGHAQAGKLMDTACTFFGSGVAAENDRGFVMTQRFARVRAEPQRGDRNQFNPHTRVECAMTTQTAKAFRKDRKWPVKK